MALKLFNFTSFRSFSTKIQANKVGVIGCTYGKGGRRSGVSNGPQAIRTAGLLKEIEEYNENVDIKDYGDITESEAPTVEDVSTIPMNMRNYHAVGFGDTMHKLAQTANKILRDGRLCMTLGGDHSIAFGK